MLDINQMITREEELSNDPHGHLAALEPWSEELASGLARREGIHLTDDHWEVIHLLRNHYRLHGPDHGARLLLAGLEERFGRQGGRKYLYQLFPRGPIAQASIIAGLPAPRGTSDPSFGSVH